MGAGGKFKAEISGEVGLNSVPIDPTKQQYDFCYVMQEEALFATKTPREILGFSARMRLMGVDNSTIGALLDDLLNALGLSICADTVVRNEIIKGISGGQPKCRADHEPSHHLHGRAGQLAGHRRGLHGV